MSGIKKRSRYVEFHFYLGEFSLHLNDFSIKVTYSQSSTPTLDLLASRLKQRTSGPPFYGIFPYTTDRIGLMSPSL